MKKILLSLCVFFLFSCSKPTASSNLNMVVASDMHYISEELNDHGGYITNMMLDADGKDLDHIDEVMDLFIEQMLQKKPDIVIFTGDLTFLGATQSHKDLAAKLQRLVNAGIRVYVFPGNHDVDTTAAKFNDTGYDLVETPNEEEFALIYANMGYTGTERDADSLSYYVELDDCYAGLFLDGQTGSFSDETLKWIKKMVKKAHNSNHEILVFAHENLLDHFEGFESCTLSQNMELISIIDQDRIIGFSGHMHPQSISQSDHVTDIATEAMSIYPFNYGWVETKDNVVTYQQTAIELPEDMNEACKNYFDEVYLRQIHRYTSEEEMTAFALMMIERTFQGCITGEEQDDPAYQKWIDSDTSYSQFFSMMIDEGNMQQITMD